MLQNIFAHQKQIQDLFRFIQTICFFIFAFIVTIKFRAPNYIKIITFVFDWRTFFFFRETLFPRKLYFLELCCDFACPFYQMVCVENSFCAQVFREGRTKAVGKVLEVIPKTASAHQSHRNHKIIKNLKQVSSVARKQLFTIKFKKKKNYFCEKKNTRVAS